MKSRIKHKNKKERVAYHSAKLYQKRKESGRCFQCGGERLTGSNYCEKCLKKQTRLYESRLTAKLCSSCGKLPLKTKTRCVECLKVSRKRRHKIKEETINEYGGKCACCGLAVFEFLTLEHSLKNGSEHRKEVGCFGNEYYIWLKKHNYPKDLGLEVLCMNCNFSKGKYGYCPHERMNNE